MLDVATHDAASFARYAQCLRAGGWLLSTVYAADPAHPGVATQRTLERGITAVNIVRPLGPAVLDRLSRMVEEGSLRVPVQATVPLEEAARAGTPATWPCAGQSGADGLVSQDGDQSTRSGPLSDEAHFILAGPFWRMCVLILGERFASFQSSVASRNMEGEADSYCLERGIRVGQAPGRPLVNRTAIRKQLCRPPRPPRHARW